MKSSQGFFITGTDTNVGKTWTTVALMTALQRQACRVAGMKPVAAGCRWLDGAWRNADALLLQDHASLPVAYNCVNPYAFERAVSPHVACGEVDVEIAIILQRHAELKSRFDVVFVEGAGGWYSPLSDRFDNAHLAIALNLPVIIVVGMRLGCINQALLTWRAVLRTSLCCAGWIAVTLDAEIEAFGENLAWLQANIDAPLLGVLPYMASADFEHLADNLLASNLAQF